MRQLFGRPQLDSSPVFSFHVTRHMPKVSHEDCCNSHRKWEIIFFFIEKSAVVICRLSKWAKSYLFDHFERWKLLASQISISHSNFSETRRHSDTQKSKKNSEFGWQGIQKLRRRMEMNGSRLRPLMLHLANNYKILSASNAHTPLCIVFASSDVAIGADLARSQSTFRFCVKRATRNSFEF